MSDIRSLDRLSLSGMSDIRGLDRLSLSGMSDIRGLDLLSLSGMSDIRSLDRLSLSGISDIRGLDRLSLIPRLSLSGISDIRGLDRLRKRAITDHRERWVSFRRRRYDSSRFCPQNDRKCTVTRYQIFLIINSFWHPVTNCQSCQTVRHWVQGKGSCLQGAFPSQAYQVGAGEGKLWVRCLIQSYIEAEITCKKQEVLSR